MSPPKRNGRKNSYQFYSHASAAFKITNTIFNKNTKAIYIDQHPGNYTNSIALITIFLPAAV